MPTVALRQVGGSVAMVIPPAFLQALNLSVGSKVDLSLSEEKLVINPVRPKVKYSLEELLNRSDFESARTEESQIWLDAPQVGNEIL
ncbi:AbrB/MazE/SpoVT family DNA-binding domain-containing protein [Actinobacillus genomosp. 1]|uniref:AbrB/MazE/SpoVT family DNA-binding domain-containing protein n=1 Tax=Actinobacillus genomosp. 1 TaxID=254839 RepID=UPI002442965C|nr:AbrB/MazE/SpoVT family DNA-binding domain-containing protein [Actinobacillus genomosp. 1]WGE35885.1 AbrB/MazE/SpoVT family DNA-binding domain-containing protein [Actinobacillus genomosp. 1]